MLYHAPNESYIENCLAYNVQNIFINYNIYIYIREFQPMTSAPGNSSLLSNQDTNWFLVYVGIEF